MSRRRSRVTPTAGTGSESRELTVDEFLRVLAKAPRAPRVSRKRSRYIADAVAWKASKASLATPGLTNRHDRDRREATFLLETPATVEGDAGHTQKLNTKTKKTTQRINTDDIEWNSLIGGVEIAKQKRRKRYVVYNSLPLSRDTDIDEFQPSNEKAQPCGLLDDPIFNTRDEDNYWGRDKPVLGAHVRKAKPLHPISILRCMIKTPKLARKTSPGRVVREKINPTRDLVLGRLRNKPGSGFDWLADSEQVDSSTRRGVLDMAVPLPCVPGTLYDQLSVQISEVETLESQPPISSLIESTFTAENYAANDCIAYHEEPSTRRLEIIHQESELPELALIGRIAEQTNLTEYSCSMLKSSEEDCRVRGPKEPCDVVGLNHAFEHLENTHMNFTGELDDIGGVNSRSNESTWVSRMNQGGAFLELGESIKDCNENSRPIEQDTCMDWNHYIVAKMNAKEVAKRIPKEMTTGVTTPLKIEDIEMGDKPCTSKFWEAQAEPPLESSYELPRLQVNTSSKKYPLSVSNRTCPSYWNSRGDPISKLTVETPPMPDFSLGRVGSDIGGQSKRRELLSGRSDDGEETEEEEPTLPVSRRLFTEKPERSYFSIAQQALNSSSGAIDYKSLDYLRRPTLGALQFPAVNETINEEDERSMNEEEEDIIVKNTNSAATYVGISRPRSIATTPITLKELLNRSGRRRTSISGIFHSKKGVESVKQLEKAIPYPNSLSSSHKAVPGSIPASSPASSPIGSKPLSVYASRRASTKVHRPYVSPLGRPLGPKQTMELRRPAGKLKRGVTMAARAETITPTRKRFKPPLLKSRANTLLQGGELGALPKRSWTNALEDGTDIGESQIDIQSISSFRAVQEAW